MKRSHSGTDLHIPTLIAPPLPLFPPASSRLDVSYEANGSGADCHRSTASNLSASMSRRAQPIKSSPAAGGDDADLNCRQGFTNPTSTGKPASVCSSRQALSASTRAAATLQAPKPSSCAANLPAQSAGAVLASDTISGNHGSVWPSRSYGCNFCGREFNSAQALGGHMNIHRRDRARLRTSLENLPPSTPAAARYYTASIFNALPHALPHQGLAEYPIILQQAPRPSKVPNLNPLGNPNSATARVPPSATNQKCPFSQNFCPQSPLGHPSFLSLPANSVTSSQPAALFSDLPLPSSISGRNKRPMMGTAIPMTYTEQLAPRQGQPRPNSCSLSKIAEVSPFHDQTELSQETSSSAATVGSSGLGARDEATKLGSSSGSLDLELRLGTRAVPSPTAGR